MSGSPLFSLSNLYMACVPFLFFLDILVVREVELGLSFYFLCSLNLIFSSFFTVPEYCKKFILTLYVALSSSYVYMLPFSFVISLINFIPFSIQDVLYMYIVLFPILIFSLKKIG